MARTRLSYTLRLDGVVVSQGVVEGREFVASPAPTAHFRCSAPGMPHMPVRATRRNEEWLREHGFVPIRAGALLYAGLVVLRAVEDGGVLLQEHEGIEWEGGGPGVPVREGIARMGAWELEFRVVDRRGVSKKELPPPSPLFVSTLAWAYVLAFSFVGLAFYYPFPPPLDASLFEDESRRVAATFHPEEEKREPEPPRQERARPKLRLVRRITFHRRTVKVRRPSAIRPRPILVQRRPTVIDLTKISAPPPSSRQGDTTVEAQAAPGVTVPVVVAAPPPPPPSPPPMAALPKPMKPAPMKPVKRVMKVKPRRLYFPRVPYPEEARQLGIEGRVKLRLYIDEHGRVYRVEVIKGLHPILDRAAVRAARRARYAPARDQFGRPMKAVVVVTIRFVLEE